RRAQIIQIKLSLAAAAPRRRPGQARHEKRESDGFAHAQRERLIENPAHLENAQVCATGSRVARGDLQETPRPAGAKRRLILAQRVFSFCVDGKCAESRGPTSETLRASLKPMPASRPRSASRASYSRSTSDAGVARPMARPGTASRPITRVTSS